MTSIHQFSLAVALLFAVLMPAGVLAESVDSRIERFLNDYCVKCHGPENQEADFRVDRLRVSKTVGDAEYWQLVLDNLHLGEMPPEDEKQPAEKEREAVTSWIESELRRARRVLSGESGEVVLRRLNRTEYEYTIEDLFGVRGDYADGFPADATAESFDNNGAVLMLSSEQITQYMQAADHILSRSIQTGPRPKTQRSAFTLHDFNREAWKRHREQIQRRLKNFDELTQNEQKRTREMQEALKDNPHDGFSFPVWEDGKLRVPTPDDGPEVDAVIAIKATYGAPDTRRVFSARHAGWYRFRVVAYAVQSDGVPVRLKISYGSFRQGTIPKVADVLYLNESDPKEFEYRLYLQPNEIVKLQMIDGTNWARREDQIELPGPFVAIREMEMEGPLYEDWPPAGHRTLLGTRDANELSDQEMPNVLAELAPRLFRRQVDPSVVRDYLHFYQATRRQDETPLNAFKLTAKAMMASPHFLYHVETGGKPDAFALANRLSYFLWRSAPDSELLELAASGRLSQKDELTRQVDRLLADPKSERFIKDFVGQWLEINRVGEMQPDSNLYPEYDQELEQSMIEETRSFVREILSPGPESKELDRFRLGDAECTNGRALRHPRRSGQPVSPRVARQDKDHSRRFADTGQYSERHFERNNHLAGCPRRLGIGAVARHSCTTATARRPGDRAGHSGRKHDPGSASQASLDRTVRVVPSQDRPVWIRIGKFRRDRRLARKLSCS